MNKWWQEKPLTQFTAEEWELVCDGCGLCCLIKTRSGGQIHTCAVGCRLLDIKTNLCKNYAARQSIVESCIKVTLDKIDTPGLLPETCAYKLLKHDKPLFDWHHLVSGSRDTVVTAGIAASNVAKAVEDQVPANKIMRYALIDY